MRKRSLLLAKSEPRNLSIDYNGDGTRDLLTADFASGYWHVASYQPSTSTTLNCDIDPESGEILDETLCTPTITAHAISTGYLNVKATGLEGQAQVMDVNGDGMEDIVFRSGSQLKAHINNGDGTFTANHLLLSLGSSTSNMYLNEDYTSQTASMKAASAIDVNGDGRSDLIAKISTETVQGCFIWGELEEQYSYGQCLNAGGNWVSSASTNYKLLISSGPTSAPTLEVKQNIGSASISNIRVADFNGDGLTDVAYVVNNAWKYRLSDGTELSDERDMGLATDSTRKGLNQFVDLNNDGRADVLHATSTNLWSIYFSRPTRDAQWISFEKRGAKSFDNNAVVRFGDTNGDGKLDMLTSTNGTWKQYTSRANIKEYVIDKITNGFGVETNITYSPMTDNSVYLSNTSDFNADSDTFSPMSGMQLVSQVTTDSNTNSSVGVSYQYGGLLVHKKGRGSLGFQLLRTTDLQSSVVSETHYNQQHDSVNFAKARMPIYSQQSRNGEMLSSASNTLAVIGSAQGGLFPYIAFAEEKSYVNGTNGYSTHISTTDTTSIYDNWGNLTNSTTKVNDIASGDYLQTVTSNTYGSTEQYRQNGRLTATNVTKSRKTNGIVSTKPTRDSAFTYYDNLMLKTSVVSPGNPLTKLTTTYGYDDWGNKTSTKIVGYSTETGGIQTRESKTFYDYRGRYVSQKINALNQSIQYEYNGTSADAAMGKITEISEKNLNIQDTKTFTNDFGQVTKVELPNGNIKYIANNFCLGTCSSNGYYKRTETITGAPIKEVIFDKWGREVESRVEAFDGTWNSVYITYDSQGRRKTVSEPSNSSAVTTMYYDALGRVSSVMKPDSSSTNSSYDGLSQITTNALNQVFTTIKNGFGETSSTLDELGNIVSFIYDANGSLAQTDTHAEGKTSSINVGYDDWGRKTSTTDPIKGTWSYGYNAFGELMSQTTEEGHTTEFMYDKLGRKTRSYEASEGTLCWIYGTSSSYKEVGKIIETAKYESANATCGSGTPTVKKVFTYDTLGRPYINTTTISGYNYIQSQNYDSASRPLLTTYPSGNGSFAVKSLYNQTGYLFAQVNNNTGFVLKRIDSMTARGQVENVTYGSGVSSNMVFDSDTGFVKDIYVNGNTGQALNAVHMEYDVVGNVKVRKSNYLSTTGSGSHFTENYFYDNVNRLTKRTFGPNANTSLLPSDFKVTHDYIYDDWGNFTFKTGVGYYKYNNTKVHKLEGVYSNSNHTGTLYNFTYDGNGNIKSDGVGGRSITYSSFDKPTYISKGSSYSSMKYGVDRQLYYKYDKKIESSNTNYYAHTYVGAFEKIVRTGGSGSLTEYKYNLGDIVYTQRNNATEDIHYLHKDHQGSIIATTNHSGNVVQQAIYDPFGKSTDVYIDSVIANLSIIEPTERGYTGHRMMDDVGIIHMNGRIYDPTLGRFLQADPFIQAPKNSQNYNRYSYVLNNPMSYTDPSGFLFGKLGKFFKKWWKPIVAIVATVVTYGAASGWVAGWGATWGTAATATSAATLTTAGGIAAGAIAGGVGGFVGGALMTGSLKGAFTGALKGAFSGAIFGGVAGHYGDTWNFSRVMSNSVAGGISGEATGGSFREGFKLSLALSMARLGWEHIKGRTNMLKLRATKIEGNRPAVYNKHGELMTYSNRDMSQIVGTDAGDGNWFTNLTKDSGMEGTVFENKSSLWARSMVGISKGHDFWNSDVSKLVGFQGYDSMTGMVLSGTETYNTAFQAWSLAGMVPTAAYTGIAMTANAPYIYDWHRREYYE